MTLFRRVFQSQGAPAHSEDVPDPEELRESMARTAGETSPYVLDPFNHAVDNMETTDDWETDPDALVDDMPEIFEPEPEDIDEALLRVLSEPETERDQPENVAAAPAIDPDTVQSEIIERAMSDQFEILDAADASETGAAEEIEDNSVADADERSEAHTLDVLQAKLSETDPPTDGKNAAEIEQETAPETDCAGDAEEQKEDPSDFARKQLEALGIAPRESDVIEPVEGAEQTGVEISGALDLSQMDGLAAVPAPAAGRVNRRVGRVKTRLLGFNREAEEEGDPFGQMSESTATQQREKFPVGWLVVVDGPGVGHAFSIFTGASMIGRGDDQMIRLDFGDNSISRQNHAAIAYDEEANKFYVGHGGKSNIIRRNARPVLSTEELHHADLLRIGETTLRFVALCGSDFQWSTSGDTDETRL